MAHEGIFCTSDEVISKAGDNYPVAVTEARINDFCAQIESEINCVCRYNFSDAYAALNADVKRYLSLACSAGVACMVINYDMSGFTSRTEAEDMVNINRDIYLRALSALRDKNIQTFVVNQ